MHYGRDDKRKYPRMQMDSEVTFSRPGSQQNMTGQAKNLSADGLCFITPMAVAAGETLTVTVHPGSAITPSLDTRMKVTRVIEQDQHYEVAGILQAKAS